MMPATKLTPVQSLAELLKQDDGKSAVTIDATSTLAGRIRGWSTHVHYAFFKALMAATKDDSCTRILMLGVYQGRDLAFLMDAVERFHPGRIIDLTGVDAFADTPCADWESEKAGKTWEQAGFGPPPSFELARSNLASLGHHNVTLVQRKDEVYLDMAAAAGRKWDIFYIDTSHDHETVSRQIKQVAAICAGSESIICGDDFGSTGHPTWGVDKAVREAFSAFGMFNETIWFSDAAHLKS